MKKKGISLIVLIITIVVIIILAAAIIVNIANTNLIENASAAVFKSDVSAMQDELTMYISDEFINEQGKYDSKKLQATEEGIWYGSNQQEGTITDIIKSMDEKYVGKLFIQDGKLVANKMAITVEEEKWLNDLGIMSTTKTDIGILNITPSTKDWTNVNVELEINYTQEIPAGYAIEYKVNAGNWQEGTRVVVEKNNTIVTARLYSKEKDNEALTNSYEVSKIDKEVPDITNMKITITAGTNNVTAIASGAIDELSGLDKYQYSIDGTTWQDSGVFSGYKNATEVTVYAKAIDKVGNESESISNTGTTTSISSPTLNLVNDEWTKDDVIASVTGTVPEGYVLEYKLSGGMTKDWTTYTGNVTINVNNTTMVARYYNEVIDDEIATPSKTASRIDKFAPDIIAMKVTLTATENTITAVASGATDSLSGEIKYKYSSDGTVWQDSGTFSGIKSGTETTVYAKAIDKVGNESASVSNKGTTTAISGTVTIAQNPAAGTWTNGNVTVTLSYANIPTGYVMQYKLGTGNWTTYSSALTILDNNTKVTARLYNSSVNDEVSVSSKTVANIDKVAPDITAMKVTLTATENTITAVASGATDSLSGLSKYQYSINNSTWQDSGTFSGIKSGTATTVYAKAIDKVGNESASVSNKGTTTAISGTVTIAQNPAATKSDGSVNWTKGNVSVTLSYANIPTGYVMQYKLGTGNWTAYSSALTVSENNTVVTARLYNSSVNDEVSVSSKTIANIDKVVPTTPTSVSITVGTNSVTATATGSSDTLSGLSKYQYSLNNSTWQDSGTFSGIKSGTATTVYARAVDKVGNVSGSISNKGTTTAISGNVSIAQNPAATKSDGSVNWTKGNVSVTLSYSNIPSGYVIQYSLSGGMALGWTAYSSAISVTANNTTVKARLYNATAADEVAVNSKVISNIDKAAPVTTNMKLTLSSTSNSVTAVASGATDSLSGLSKYQYSINNSTWQDSGTFSGIKSGTATTVYAKAIDKVGNTSNAINKSISTKYNQIAVNTLVEGANATIYGEKPAYNNPVIPVGFKAINTNDATWEDTNSDGMPDGWNNGLVIADKNGNEFVWVPVDGTNVTYAKWCTSNISYTSTSDDTEALPTVNGTTVDENAQITKYGGFYIGRYEAGVPGKTGTPSNSTGKPTVQQGATVWTNINYANSNASAKSFVNTDNVKSSLVTGTQWDTVMKWIENAGISVTDSTTWGNYSDSASPANVTGYGTRQTAGYSEYWKAKNIYDLAGNTWEWTGEIYSTRRVCRGGFCTDDGSSLPASCRSRYNPPGTYGLVSFRLTLYIM